MNKPFSLLGFNEQLWGWQKLLPYALVLSITFAVYGTTLYFGFEWDDHVYVEQNIWIQKLSPLHLHAMWSASYLGHYAPLLHTFLAVLYHFFGQEPFGYHLAQFLLHAACVCLLYAVLEKLESPRVALLAVILFAVHPTNVETVAWAAEIKSTLAFLFFLLSFLSYIRYRSSNRRPDAVLSGLFLLLSLLSKINTIVAPAIFLLYDYRQHLSLLGKRAWALAGLFLISAGFVAIHLASFFWSSGSLVSTGLESSYYGGLGVHIQNIPAMVFFYVQMVFYPYPLTAWHMFPAKSRFDLGIGIEWLVIIAGLGFLYRLSRNTQFWCLWFLLFLAPVLQIIPNLTWVADRYLYIPAIGIFVLVSRGFFRVWERIPIGSGRWAWEFGMTVLLFVAAWKTINYLPAFRNDLFLWESTTNHCQTSAICHAGFGEALLDNGQVERGMKEMIQSVEIRPSPQYLLKLGNAFETNVHDYRQAMEAYQAALASGHSPFEGDLYARMARVQIRMGNLDEALKMIQASSNINSSTEFLWIVESFYEWKRGNLRASRELLTRILFRRDQTSGIAGFLNYNWSDPAEVGRYLADLRRVPEDDSKIPR